MANNRKPLQAPPVLLYPFAGCEPEGSLTDEQVLVRMRLLRQKVREHMNNPGLVALVELFEIRAAGMQKRAIHPTGSEHERGQAYGAGQMAGLVREIFLTEEVADGEDSEETRRRGGKRR